MDHGILLEKLHSYGLKFPAVTWFKSYLSNRHQITKVNNHRSSPCKVTCGVPQGSILGPLLFTLYVNDLKCQVNQGTCHLYADDTAVTFSGLDGEELEMKLHNSIVKLADWFKLNKLSLNLEKCKVMCFGKRFQCERVG